MLGNVPPRLGGVRVYEKNTHDDEVPKFLTTAITVAPQVVIDLDLMYSGNGSLVFSLQSMRCEIKKVKMVVINMLMMVFHIKSLHCN